MERDPRAFLWDAREAADTIAEFTQGLDAERYRLNPLVRSAVERQFEIIGEALNQLSRVAPDVAQHVPRLPEIVGFRNLLIHGYSKIDHELVWDKVANLLPDLRRILDELLSDSGSAEA
jgi:uncharacterized protein with HEPN domain